MSVQFSSVSGKPIVRRERVDDRMTDGAAGAAAICEPLRKGRCQRDLISPTLSLPWLSNTLSATTAHEKEAPK